MRRMMARASAAAAVVWAASLGACTVSLDDDGRGEDPAASGDERGTWQSAGKADDSATCRGACGDQSLDGCWCDESCVAYGDCCPDKADVCDGGGTDDGGDAPPAGGGGSGSLCFPGPGGDSTTCVPVVPASSVGSGYDYPAPLSGNANYRAPIAFIDLEAVGDVQIAANFKLSEVAQTYKGRYAVVQPHAIRRLQDLRDELGAIKVNSGYRSPSYNASIDGATHSRHMFGDGFDLAPQAVSLGTLESACERHGGMLVEYTSHVHCDWRYDSVDPVLFGAAALGQPELELSISPFSAALHERDGLWTAPAEGFDEGEPLRRWTALDADGEVIYEATGDSFAPPSGTASLEVLVGGRVALATELPVAR